MVEFTTDAEPFQIANRGWAFAVKNDRETYDFDHLMGKDVKVNGVVRKCVGVERFLHCAPWRKGELISLLFREL